MLAFKFDFEARSQRLLHQRHDLRIRRIDMLHQYLTVIDRIGQRDHSGSENVTRSEFARIHYDITSNQISYETAHLLKITNVIARQLGIGFGQFRRAHRDVAIVKLFRRQKFARRGRRQFESFRWVDLVQLLQKTITLGALRLTKNIKTKKPCRKSRPG